jgi:hypothetical protein
MTENQSVGLDVVRFYGMESFKTRVEPSNGFGISVLLVWVFR